METISRRELIAGVGAAGTLGILSQLVSSDAWAQMKPEPGKEPGVFMHQLPPLPYPEDALEPVIDKETVKIHHDKSLADVGHGTGGQKAPVNALASARIDLAHIDDIQVQRVREVFIDGVFRALQRDTRKAHGQGGFPRGAFGVE